jgi:polyketide synthase 7
VLDPQLAIKALEQAVDGGETCVTVADVEWERFAPVFTSLRTSALLGELPAVRGLRESRERDAVPGDGTEQRPGGLTALGEKLVGSSPATRRRTLLELVRGEAAAALGHDGTAAVPPKAAFSDLGVDSMTAVEIRNRLAEAIGVELPPTLVFDYPTSAALAERLTTEILEVDGPASDEASDETRIRRALATVPMSRLRDAGVLDLLLKLVDPADPDDGTDPDSDTTSDTDKETDADADSIDDMDLDALIETALGSTDS